ncbi:hypothetical protein [Jannaschia formosa]|uniref:hypothetical protein n=1 Tax=Jannaschia formosa TaxID=2259592 RepID=UPI000E1B8D22|nr:hypothetical protein [Jannaschia formosa]TFL18455.1 hypothetical protein DR046_10210 [Jannaschia formosa]
MRGLLLLSFLLLPFAAGPAPAGPWPRPVGETYVFSGHEGGTEGWTSLYLETGLPRDLTLGLDAGGHVTALATGDPDQEVDGRIRAFLRFPVLSAPDRRAARPAWAEPWLAAIEIGIGPDIEKDGDTPLRYGAALTLGRPLDTRFGPGWTVLDLRATLGGSRPARVNLGYVAGVKPTDRMVLELGLFAEHEAETSWAIAPTMEYKIGAFGGARLGVSVKDGGETLLRLGWARTF